MSLITDYSRGIRNHKVWLIPVFIVVVVVYLVHRQKMRRAAALPAGQAPEQAAEAVSEQAPEAPAAPQAAATQAPPAPHAQDVARALVDEALRLEQAGDLPAARAKCREALKTLTSDAARRRAEQLLGRLHVTLALTKRSMPEKVEYTVQRGDTLGGLARRFDTTTELIKASNGLKDDVIRIGDRLRILVGDFGMRISKKQNDLLLELNGSFFKRYRVGTGQYSTTPTGTFHITEKIIEPTWWRPDGKAVPFGHQENVLGTRWMSLDLEGYGIHGTWEPETIGKQASAGCVRLLNKDVEELYTLVPTGTPVTITD